ncbi:MAG: glycoside hydrolase family 3 N-terminal domain-containing protein [Jatrophihabitans sp.]|uniref:glycoside hydrolase family 3 N-terminal domain-containing protein n=1 Tax=Jatrophihabitans sp. TaxID=1932789 RepID=UPI00390F7E5D
MRLLPLAGLLLVAACTTSGQGTSSDAPPSSAPGTVSARPSPTPRTSSAPPSTHRSTPAPAPSTKRPPPAARSAAHVLAGMNLRDRVGQLLMVDCSTTGVSAATSTAIGQDHVGSVILDGTSYAGLAATRTVTDQLRGLAPKRVGLFISTDQEGGLVQRLQGAGFTRIVSGVDQGRIAPSTLQGYAQGWGRQLRRAGVNVNLAPVLDVVPAGFGSNPPIGDLEREFGHTPSAVTTHGVAVAKGMAAAGVDATVKHFPGLGRVSGNTDTTGGITDSITTRDDAYLAPFRAAIGAGVPFVMMSTAIYSRIDPGTPAAFSRTIVTGMLRGDLGFHGVIISDDLGGAAQVADYSPGQRAIAFVAAGGDLVLTVNAAQAGEMTAALRQKAAASPAFRKLVDAAALRVLQAKQGRGLLG